MPPLARHVPWLESGDRLTQPEFHRRYELHPEINRAHLVEGIVHIGHRVPVWHGEGTARMIAWLGTYGMGHPGCDVLPAVSTILDQLNEIQPDSILRRPSGGTSRLDADDYIVGPPELTAEVCASSVSIDLHEKKEAYRRNGVGEYIVWRVDDEAIDWFRLDEGTYVPVEPDAHGIIESVQFPGLRVDVKAMLAGDAAAVAAAVR